MKNDSQGGIGFKPVKMQNTGQSRQRPMPLWSWLWLPAAVLQMLILTPSASAQNTLKRELPQYGHLNNWTHSQPLANDAQFEQIWTETVGHGRSQVIVDGDRVFVAAGEDEKRQGKPSMIHSRLLCLDLYSGDEIWKRESDPTEMYDKQESFSGAPISPRATPTIIGDSICTVSYTGTLECVDTETGELRWKQDLVNDLKANPVQFGFSASPVADATDPDRLYVMAAGPRGGLYCLSLKDGSTIWRADCKSASYSTPTFATFNGVRQLIVISKDAVLGIDADNGLRLWSHDLAEKGLTNVPSPIVLPEGIIVSGQGCKGTRRFDVAKKDGRWETKEKWYSRKMQFFYSNWMLAQPNIAIGCDDKLMLAFNTDDGSILGRWRGFSDGNILKIGDSAIVVDGKGNLNVLLPQIENTANPHILHAQKIALLDQRCWTPATSAKNRLLLRGGDQLTMVSFSKRSNQPLPNKLKKPKALALKKVPAKTKDVDHVLAIFETFEQKGVDAAMRMYSRLRSKVPCPLAVEDRIELFNAAKQQGMNDLAKMILAHAAEDFPESKEIRELAKDAK